MIKKAFIKKEDYEHALKDCELSILLNPDYSKPY